MPDNLKLRILDFVERMPVKAKHNLYLTITNYMENEVELPVEESTPKAERKIHVGDSVCTACEG